MVIKHSIPLWMLAIGTVAVGSRGKQQGMWELRSLLLAARPNLLPEEGRTPEDLETLSDMQQVGG